MKTEYEVRILEIDHEDMVKKLEALGAEFKFSALQQRYVYDFNPREENRWIRLRTNGTTTTLTIKDVRDVTIDGTTEQEVEVSDFNGTNEILETLGYKHRNFQQNKRTQYKLDGVEVDLDEWPLIPEYMEIEGESEEAVYQTLDKLGIPRERICTLDVTSVYEQYGIDVMKIADLKFEDGGKKHERF